MSLRPGWATGDSVSKSVCCCCFALLCACCLSFSLIEISLNGINSKFIKLHVGVQPCNQNTWEAEAGNSRNVKSAWATDK